jgi:regulator of sirC expression with transglutaminase-like and TPR domain
MGLRIDPELALFAHVVARPEPELDLAQASLLIAAPEYRDLDLSEYLSRLDEIGSRAQRELARAGARAGSPILQLVRWLYEDLGFRGNAQDYYDPKNSFLNEVLDRKTGIPITLAVVVMEVARRAALVVQGVSFPGHFLLRAGPSDAPLFINPFDGKLLTRPEIRALLGRATGEDREVETRLLEPATKRQILVRMLNNLRGIYSTRGDKVRLLGVLERMAVLVRSEEVRRQLELLGGSGPWPSGGHASN